VCIALCTIVAHNIAQNRPDSFSPYPPDNHHCSDDVYLREGGLCGHNATNRTTSVIYVYVHRQENINKWPEKRKHAKSPVASASCPVTLLSLVVTGLPCCFTEGGNMGSDAINFTYRNFRSPI